MNKPYQLLLALGVAAASLSSCSRANYAVNAPAPALASVPVEQQPSAVVTTRLAEPVRSVEVTAAPVALPSVATRNEVKTVASAVQKHAKPSLVERVLLKKVAKQIAKAQATRQNTASVEQTAASKTGRAAIIAGVGLVLLLLGGAANVGIIAVIGLLAFIVGIILVVVHLVSGD